MPQCWRQALALAARRWVQSSLPVASSSVTNESVPPRAASARRWIEDRIVREDAAVGVILIGVRRRGNEWRIDVVDTGVGIEPGQLGAVFGEFTRLMGGLHWNPVVRINAVTMRRDAIYYALHDPRAERLVGLMYEMFCAPDAATDVPTQKP